ncbi:MAG: hypothetical protein ABIU11_01825 [Chitinophagaceae bacterium]
MNNKRNNKVEDILGSLDGNQRASAPDFFYTRLKARMEKGFEPVRYKSWALRPVYAMAAFVIVLLINVAVILQGVNSNEPATANIENETIQSIAAEYNLNDTITEEVYK